MIEGEEREEREGEEGEGKGGEEKASEAPVEELRRLKEELAAQWENARRAEELETQTRHADALQHDLETAKSSSHIEELTGELEKEKGRARSVWHLNCEQIA